MEGRQVCQTCMDIRRERTWCDKCRAPVVYADNLPVVELFLDALPAWRTTGMDRILEGFDRGEILALMQLRNVADPVDTWLGLSLLESELARIRAEQHEEKLRGK